MGFVKLMFIMFILLSALFDFGFPIFVVGGFTCKFMDIKFFIYSYYEAVQFKRDQNCYLTSKLVQNDDFKAKSLILYGT